MKLKTLLVSSFLSSTSFASFCPAPELIPVIESLKDISCTECRCVAGAFGSTVTALQSERARSIKPKLKISLDTTIVSAMNAMVDADRILMMSGGQGSLNTKTLENCNLDRIASEASCPGASNSKHLKELFNTDSIASVVANMKANFHTAGDIKAPACMTKEEGMIVSTASSVVASFEPLLKGVKDKKNDILAKLKSGKNIFEALSQSGLDTYANDVLSLADNPVFRSFLFDKTIANDLITNIDTYVADSSALIRYVMQEAGNKVDGNLLNESLQMSCNNLIETVKTAICAEDRIAQSYYPDPERPSPSLNDLTAYDPTMHDPSYDAEMASMMDDPNVSLVEGSYAGHLYWCSAKECSQKDDSDSCHQQALSKKENKVFSDLVAHTAFAELSNQKRNSFNSGLSNVCSLAGCSKKPEKEQAACIETEQKKMGEIAGPSVAAIKYISSLSQPNSNNEPGVNYKPYSQLLEDLKNPSPLAKAFVGEQPSEILASNTVAPNVTGEANTGVIEDGEVTALNPAQNNKTSGNGKVSGTNNKRTITNKKSNQTTSGYHGANNGFFADNAFNDFMSRIPKTVTDATETKKPELTDREKRALEVSEDALEEMKRMQDDYRRNAFEQMGDQLRNARNNQQQYASIGNQPTFVAPNANNNQNYNANQEQPQFAQNPQGVAPNLGGGGVQGSGYNATGARSPSGNSGPRLTMQGGQPTLNVGLNELPSMDEGSVKTEGVDPNQPFKLAVTVDKEVFVVSVKPTIIGGKRILAPMLDQLSPSLRSQVLKSPLFADYRRYLMKELSGN